MTESLHAVVRVGRDGRIVALGLGAAGFLGGAPGMACAALVRAVEPSGRAVCRSDCARSLAESDPPRREARAAVVRGQLSRIQCERVGDEVVVVVVTSASADASSEALTARERAVLTLVAEGMTDREAAAALGIRPSTVRTHVEHARDKLGAKTRAQAAMRARALGQLE